MAAGVSDYGHVACG